MSRDVIHHKTMTDIVAFGAHPDDIEFGCGGILAKAASQGHSIVIVDLTTGEKATNGTPDIRCKEAQAAAQLIGATRLTLDFADCEVFDSYEGRLKLMRIIRKYRARLVLAPAWDGVQNHPDHLACGIMARHACRYARFANIEPEIPAHRPDGILHYLPRGREPDILIDVSESVDLWRQMMETHQSQMRTLPYSEWMLKNAANYGIMINRPYAQGLISGNPIVVDDVMSVAKGTNEV